jgi:2-iminobutanoate/2-iminopropanoate deaminase
LTLRHVTLGAGTSIGGAEPVISDAVTLGDVVYLSGRAPVDPATLTVLEGGFDLQARSVLADIDAVLALAGSSRSRVLRVECFLADAADFPAWNRLWCEHFATPRPARTTVVAAFAVPGILIELQVTAGLEPAEAS